MGDSGLGEHPAKKGQGHSPTPHRILLMGKEASEGYHGPKGQKQCIQQNLLTIPICQVISTVKELVI